MGRKEAHGLTKDELAILKLICKNGKAHSSVWIAAELYGQAAGDEDTFTLEQWDVELCLEKLGALGLVRYTEHTPDGGNTIGKAGKVRRPMLIRIHPYKKAYELTGVEFKYVHVVGDFHRANLEPHEAYGDKTDFRGHGEYAKGVGPIERMRLDEHILAYIDHADCHWQQYEELHAEGKC